MNFQSYFNKKRQIIEKKLSHLDFSSHPSQLAKAEIYSLLAGGKRLRPVLALMTEDLLMGDDLNIHQEDLLTIGASLEAIHTYSLIHDDLPAMDNDTLRRGQQTCHIKYGESKAILAGDSLLTWAFENLSSLKNHQKKIPLLIGILAKNSGGAGMVGGQVMDLYYENKQANLSELKQIHYLKTGKLICSGIELAAKYLIDDEKLIKELIQYGYNLGMLFQITDDIIDVTSSSDDLGKDAGSDKKRGKSTYVSLLGVEGANKKAKEAMEQSIEKLNSIKAKNPALFITRFSELSHFIYQRKN